MAKVKEQLLEKIVEFKELGLLIGELPKKVSVQELKGLVAETEELANKEGDTVPIDLTRYFETAEEDKAWYIKDEFFKKFKIGVKKKDKNHPPQEVKEKVDYIFLNFGKTRVQFFKDVPLTDDQLAIFERPSAKLIEPLIEETKTQKARREIEAERGVKFRKEKYLEFR